MIKAFIFDLDGVLTDTERIGIEVAEKICKNLDIQLTNEEKLSFIGITDLEFYQKLFKKRNLDFNVYSILVRHFEIYEHYLHNNPLLFPEAKETVTFIKKKGYKLGMVSGSTKKQIELILKKTNLYSYFDTIISCDDVVLGKPHPEGYLICSKKLNVYPHQCLVVEDSESGIKAAKNAGMKVISFNNTSQNVKADWYISNLEQIRLHFDEIVKV